MSIPTDETAVIGNNAFENCQKLSTVNAQNVTYIGSRAFKNCSNLSSAALDNANFIGINAFEGTPLWDKSAEELNITTGIEKHDLANNKQIYMSDIEFQAVSLDKRYSVDQNNKVNTLADMCPCSEIVTGNTVSACLDSIQNRLSGINLENIAKNKAFIKDALKKIIVLFGGTVSNNRNSLTTQLMLSAAQPTDISVVCNVFKPYSNDSTYFSLSLSSGESTETFTCQDNGEIYTIQVKPGKSVVSVSGLINKNAILHDDRCIASVIEDAQSDINDLCGYYLVDVQDIDQDIIEYGFFDLSGNATNLDDNLLGNYDEMTFRQIYVPAGETQIDDYKFSQMKDCRKVIFSNAGDLSAIGSYAFANNIETESLVIPDGVEWIGSNAFTNCGNLKIAVFPASLTAIYDNAFSNQLTAPAYSFDSRLSDCSTISAVIDKLQELYPEEREEYTDEDYEKYTEMSENVDYDAYYEWLESHNFFVVNDVVVDDE